MRTSSSIAPAAALVAAISVALLLHGCEDDTKPTAPPTATPPRAVAAAGQEGRLGKWSAPFSWGNPPIVAVHASVLPNGKVFTFGLRGGGDGKSLPQVWDPATGSFTSVPSPEGHWVMCAGHSFLPDGKLLVAGGHIATDRGQRDAAIFDPASGEWTDITDMHRGRWYPTVTTLPDGAMLVLGGSDENGADVGIPEVWKVGGGWKQLTTANQIQGKSYWYPWMFVANNGRVFYAGPRKATKYLNTSGTGAWTSVAPSNFGYRSYGSAVMYRPNKVLIVGGGDPPTNTAEIINLYDANPRWTYTGSMAYPRRQLNATLLPNGDVLVTGGVSGSGFNNLATAVYAAELWEPNTGRWTTLASSSVPRGYHTTAIVLPDARVLYAGSGDVPNRPLPSDQKNAEIYSPPYLFNADGSPASRPTIESAPGNVAYGQTFFVGTQDAASINTVNILRLGSVTHAFDENQRSYGLPFTQTSGGLNVTAPTSRNAAPPGHYMLFILRGGVPSEAKIIRLG